MEGCDRTGFLVVSTATFRTLFIQAHWYNCSLKNHGVENEVEGMFEMGAETMDLPLEEKLKFDQGVEGRVFG